MNKIDRLFTERGDKKLLSLYFCAGDPTLEGTADVIRAMERRGIAMVEVGFPFSDPLADGPVIQTAATRAIRNGMTISKLFAQLKEIKDEVSIPLVLMGYLNVVMQYGVEAFFKATLCCRVECWQKERYEYERFPNHTLHITFLDHFYCAVENKLLFYFVM